MAQIPPGLAGMVHDGPPVKPRPAATVLLLRGSRPWEVLTMRRPGGADFAPGANVFPGGSVHPEDRLLGDPLRSAGVRELFEELGILLARSSRGFATGSDAERLRLRLAHGVSFPTALKEARLEPALDELTYFARWVTPEQLRRRFDTRFYLARLPDGQEVHPQPGEVEAWSWVEPSQALGRPDFAMVFATRRVLEMVAVDADAESLLERYRKQRRVKVVRPVVRIDGGRVEVVTETLPKLPRARASRSR
ncbi:MAG: NUDIX hydrolase [Chloroflexi bacterium]|nr:MAG: NUDIX hydrolase [Chloroflexota bacterium]TMD52460.1 MAG: NUDIX hydrolase [Chloroflexota bacterium]